MGDIKRVKAVAPAVGGRWFQTNFPMIEGGQWEYRWGQPVSWTNIVHDVLQIRGIERVLISPYTLSVFIPAAVLWEEVEPEIFDAFKRNYPGIEVYGVNDEIKLPRPPFWRRVMSSLADPVPWKRSRRRLGPSSCCRDPWNFGPSRGHAFLPKFAFQGRKISTQI